MAEVKSNEREFSGQIVVWLNEFIGSGSYPFENITGETSVKATGETTKFPDVKIWLNRATKQGFCDIEAKTPTTPADDQTLLEAAAEKARAINADHFVTWNMRNAILWRTPQAGTAVSASDRVKAYQPVTNITKPEDMWVKSNEVVLKVRAGEILDDLKKLYYDHTLNDIEADTTFFVGRLHNTVETLFPSLRDALLNRIGGDNKFKQALRAWGVKQGIARVDDADFHEAVAKQLIYRLLVRILFYLTLQKQWRELPELSITGLSGQAASAHLQEIFANARALDWHAVFEEGLPDEIELPDAAIHEIGALLHDLKRFNFGHMPHDVIGAVFEQLIPQQERHTLGQYFTPENLVDLILAFCLRQRDDKVLDPTCGTGTFLLRAYNKKKNHLGLVDHKQLLPQIWGVDISHFPAELATINLFRQNLTDYRNFPRIIVKDFFDVKTSDTYDFPPPKADLKSGFDKVYDPIPQFDAAVGNFPFIRQELIEKSVPHYKDKLEKVITKEWLADYPDAFKFPDASREQTLAALKKTPDTELDVELNLSGQADIYAYLYFHTGRFIKEGGRMGFITSNSWLDVAYGYEIQKYMVNNFKIVAIIESRCEPWFEDAAVNTVATILERCSDKAERDNQIVKFVKVKKKLAELIPWDIKLDALNRWQGLDGLIQQIERAGDDCLKIEGTKVTNTLKGVETLENDNFRIRMVKQSELREQLNKEQKTAKWGPYLRAPQVYFDIIKGYSDKLVLLRDIADVDYGVKTGINDFFHVDETKQQHWNIDEQFLFPIITSPKEVEGLVIRSNQAEFRLFLCAKSKAQLRKEGLLNTLGYIEWGEKQTTKEAVTWPKVPSVRNNDPWWNLGKANRGDFMVNQFIGLRHFIAANPEKVIIGNVGWEGTLKDKGTIKICSALMNSAITAMTAELAGRVNLGEGLLTAYGPDIYEFLVPNVTNLPPEKEKMINKAFSALSERPVKPIFDEVKMKDRQKLDSLVLEAMGLDPAKYLQPIYDGLTDLVRERIELAAMRKGLKKAKPTNNAAKAMKEAMDELVKEGIKKFPDDFLTKKPKPQESMNVSVPDAHLKLGHFFMGQQEVTNGSGFSYQAASLAAAKYIVYARKAEEYIVCLPNDEKVVTKAVTGYEIYLKELSQKLNQDLLNRTFDHKQSETLSRRIFEELGLPQV